MTAPCPRTLWLEAVDAANDAGALDMYALAVAMKLARRMSSLGERCHPSLPGLAGKLGCSERRVRTALRALEAEGFVLTRAQAGPNGRNVYVPAVHGVSIVTGDEQAFPPAPRAAQTPVPPAPRAAQTEVRPAPRAARTPVPRHEVPPEQVYARHQVPPKDPAPGAAEPSPSPDVNTFSLETYGGGPVENLPAAPAVPGQVSMWPSAVEAPAAPAEGSPGDHPLAARAAAAGTRRPAKVTNTTNLCQCRHALSDHNDRRRLRPDGKRVPGKAGHDTSCNFCACTAHRSIPRGPARAEARAEVIAAQEAASG